MIIVIHWPISSPSRICEEPDKRWKHEQESAIERAATIFNDKEKYLTLALIF